MNEIGLWALFLFLLQSLMFADDQCIITVILRDKGRVCQTWYKSVKFCPHSLSCRKIDCKKHFCTARENKLQF